MSKKKVAIVFFVTVVVFGIVGYFVWKDDPEVKSGIYKVENFQKYPEAYIEVQDGEAQFVNIDLNELYKAEMVEHYIQYLTNANDGTVTEKERKEIEESIDLNKMFCEKSFVLDYSKINMQDDQNRHLYYYTFGFVTKVDNMAYAYNAKEKSIILDWSEENPIVFRKQ